MNTRDRSAQLGSTLDSLSRQTSVDHDIVVVDQSHDVDTALEERAERSPRLRVFRDGGVGLSRSRNLGWKRTEAAWIAFLDDDCQPEPGWAAALCAAIARHPDVDVVSGQISGSPAPSDDYLEVTTSAIAEEAVVTGRWTSPWKAGFGASAVRRSTIERLGGWDERLGTGAPTPFGAAEDMDFNYRLLKAGGRALVTPLATVVHEQWRSPDELVPLYQRYMAGWSGFAMKHLRGGDVLGGLWLWHLGAKDAGRMLGSAVRRRSCLRLRVGVAKVRGLVVGTGRGITYRW